MLKEFCPSISDTARTVGSDEIDPWPSCPYRPTAACRKLNRYSLINAPHVVRRFSSVTLRGVKDLVHESYEAVRHDIERPHTLETRANALSWVSAGVVLACIVYAIWKHSQLSELLAIWLPSLVAAFHAWIMRRQVGRRIGAGREFLSELTFVRLHLIALAPDDRVDEQEAASMDMVTETLRLMCRAAGEHVQRQL